MGGKKVEIEIEEEEEEEAKTTTISVNLIFILASKFVPLINYPRFLMIRPPDVYVSCL